MGKKNLNLIFNNQPLEVSVDRLIVAGWVGKDKEALQEHINELKELGVEPPGRTPTYMNMDPNLLTHDSEICVVAPQSSGEVECIVISDREGHRYLGVGSDHTDRAFEVHSIPASKQMCSKPVAIQMWSFSEVKDYLDELILRSWMVKDGNRQLYQEGTLGQNISIEELLTGIPEGCVETGESFCLYCGTFSAIGGLSYGERFEFEIFDPQRNRSIQHGYNIRVLPQFI